MIVWRQRFAKPFTTADQQMDNPEFHKDSVVEDSIDSRICKLQLLYSISNYYSVLVMPQPPWSKQQNIPVANSLTQAHVLVPYNTTIENVWNKDI